MTSNSQPERSKEQQLLAIVAALHQRWRFFVAIPMIYLAIGVAVQRFWFDATRNGQGLMPLTETSKILWFFIGAVLVALFWRLAALSESRHLIQLTEVREKPAEFLSLALDQQLLRFIFCDAAAYPGIIMFLLTGEAMPLLVFCFISLGFFLKEMPNERRLGAAFLRPDLIQS